MLKKYFMIVLVLILMPAAMAKSGSIKLLAVTNTGEELIGSVADMELEIKEGTGRVFIASLPLSRLDTQISTRFAKEVACNFLERDCSRYDFFYRIRSTSGLVGGPSAGAGAAVLTVAVLEGLAIDQSVSITGTINSGGIIGQVGGITTKLDAAAKNGIAKVLIPKYMQLNLTNGTGNNTVEIIEISHLSDAVKEITGKEYATEADIELSQEYVEVMQRLSDDICSQAEKLLLSLGVEEEYYSLARAAQESGRYYSAASYCFVANVNLKYEEFMRQNLTVREAREKIDQIKADAILFRANIENNPIDTLTDLETYMIVSSRISEAEAGLSDVSRRISRGEFDNSTIYSIAYATERLNTARSWSGFFNTFGTEFNIDKEALNESCLEKISEVEERIQYLELYLPEGGNEAREAIVRSNTEYNNGNPEICLYEASIAKARVDVILNTMSVDPEYDEKIIEDRLSIVKSLIAKQTARGMFPIAAYSYYEYGGSLRETDKGSALLYLEYALELGSLDIYFEEKGFRFPIINYRYLLLFGLGAVAGASFAVLVMSRKKRRGR